MKKSIFFVNTYGCPDAEHDLSKMFALMKEYNISGLQIPYDDLLKLDRDEFKRHLTESGTELVCTHVVQRLFAKDDLDFDNALNVCRKALEDISFFGCKYLMPMAFHTADVDGFSDKERARERLAEGLEILTKESEKYGIRIIVENISQTILPFSTVEDIEYLINRVPELDFCFDTGNFVCIKADTVEAFERLKDKISMVHVKDFGICQSGGYKCDSGINVEHVDFGTGGTSLCDVMKKLTEYKPDIPYIIEIHSCCPEKSAIEQACNFFDGIKVKL